jgi:hypothetical protein
MGLARMVTRRSGTTIVLGAVVSLGVVALASSAFGRRRAKKPEQPAGVDEPQPAPEKEALWAGEVSADAPRAESPPREYLVKPPPPRDPGAPRWDTPPSTLTDARAP